MKKEGASISPDLKKPLLFGESLASDMQSSYKNLNSYTEKRTFRHNLKFDSVKKYWFLNEARLYFPVLFDARRDGTKKQFGVYQKRTGVITRAVQKFFEND